MTPVANPPAVLIRPGKPEDSVHLARIYNQAIVSGCSTMHTLPVSSDFFTPFLCAQDREVILVGEQNGRVVGWAVVKQYSERPGYRYACETSVYVDETALGQGVGKALQTQIMQSAGRLGYRHLVAKILAVNESSIRFHQKFGFEVVGCQRGIGYLNGQWHDVVIMQCLLDELPN